MEIFKYFFECCFHEGEGFDYLERVIQDFKKEDEESQLKFIKELHQIIHTKNYELASCLMKKYGNRTFNLEKTEKFIKFLYDRLIDRPTEVMPQDFQKNCKVVLCPVCSPDLNRVLTFSVIDKATVIDKNIQIYICKPCKLVWMTEDIRADNAQDYKKFMKTLGLKGLWKELEDIDTL